MEIHSTAVKIRLYIKRFQDSHSVYNTNVQSSYFTWRFPMNDFVKINCDGAWKSVGSSAGVGVICRDHNSLVIASQSVVFNNVRSCFEAAKGLPLKQGMMMAEELQFEKVIFETNNTNVTETIWFGAVSYQVDPVSWRHFCIEKLSLHYEWKLNLIRREANEVANVAAKHARDTGKSWISFDTCPMFVGSSVQIDT